ncbi:MAG: glycosyltransferase family 39 protein [Anaerolineae bacterium]|nr:glycosyltransferase family 39 protein [Anaerolineae bacterium]MDW8173430.1 glycosyltransferase family 39 protein [Anaerolineae bacterium]
MKLLPLKPWQALALIVLASLALRLVLSSLIAHPGIGDPNHYYNLGLRLARGQGYTIDYIWQYNAVYESVVHEDDYWMPLTGYLIAANARLFGESLSAALLPFIVIGALLPLLSYVACRQVGASQVSGLVAALTVACLPQLVMSSLRTETTIPNALFIGGTLLALTWGLRTGRRRAFVAAGIAAGLAYLTRSEAALLLPMLVVVLLAYALWGGQVWAARAWRWTWITPLLAALMAIPWLARTQALNGTFSTPTTSNMFFLTDYRDHYAFDRILSLETLLAAQAPSELVTKRLFELAATARLITRELDLLAPLALGGLLLMLLARDRPSLLALAPLLILLGGFIVFYPVLVPYKSQGGSMKKAFLSLLPLFAPLVAYALERALADERWRLGAGLLLAALLTVNAVDTVRLEAQQARAFNDGVAELAAELRALPDLSGEGDLVFMTQDPFVLGLHGLSSVVFPFEDRETILAVARRYGVDYMILPAARPALDDLYGVARVSDPRLAWRDAPREYELLEVRLSSIVE